MIAGKIGASGGSAASQPSFRLGDERLIKLTASAGNKVMSLLTKQGRPKGVLRVAVVGGGCSGLQYKMDLQDQAQNRDILVESAGVHPGTSGLVQQGEGIHPVSGWGDPKTAFRR